MMTIDDVNSWIASKSTELFEAAFKNEHAFQKERQIGAHDILTALSLYILMKTNPHNREDIKRANAKIDNDTRIEMQYEIIQFLARRYYFLDVEEEEYAHDTARVDSYKIMEIIHKYVPIKSMEG